MKPITPYHRLQNKALRFASSVRLADKKPMFLFPKNQIDTTQWNLREVRERAIAADTLGYDVRIRVTNEGLLFEYVKRPEFPSDWR